MEGAGSPAEINLQGTDIVNMRMAEHAGAKVLLVGDIDRGGVFAHLVGTLELLSESERERVAGFVINRFRGDISLLQSGLDWLEQRTGKPVLGVLPYLQGLQLDAEDGLSREVSSAGCADALRVAVPVYPRISNHTDLDALRRHPSVDLRLVGPGEPPPPVDLILLPGSKAVRDDLAWLRAQGWETAIARHLRYGGHVLGICGGFQMLGRAIHDPDGVESAPGSSEGLGWLDMETTLTATKVLRNRSARLLLGEGATSCGYEIHAGRTQGPALAAPLLQLDAGDDAPAQPDGAISDDGQILGCYLHGLLDEQAAADVLLRHAGLRSGAAVDMSAMREAAYERLADAVDRHLSMDRILALCGQQGAACAS